MKKKPAEISEKKLSHWQDLIDSIPHPISVLDNNFRFVLANKAWLDLFSLSYEQIKNMKCYELIHHQKRHINKCPLILSIKNKSFAQNIVYNRKFKKHFLYQSLPIKNHPELIYHSIINLEDIKKILPEIKHYEELHIKSRGAFLNMLEDITEAYEQREKLFMSLIKAMINALDAKSPWTKGHSIRVAGYVEQIAQKMNYSENDIKNCQLAGLLHDIGKIGTYDYLLNKTELLTPKERKKMQEHPVKGSNILNEIEQLEGVVPFIKYHHERIDGKGYPEGLSGDNIPMGSRILHVADSYDAMTSDRPYREKMGIPYAVSELKKQTGKQFDKVVVKAFLDCLEIF